MYRFTLYTHVWDGILKSTSNKLPDSEFIAVKNAQWDEVYINRNQILFYEVKQIPDDKQKENN